MRAAADLGDVRIARGLVVRWVADLLGHADPSFPLRDMAQHAPALALQASSTEKQMDQCRKMLRKPVADAERYAPTVRLPQRNGGFSNRLSKVSIGAGRPKRKPCMRLQP